MIIIITISDDHHPHHHHHHLVGFYVWVFPGLDFHLGSLFSSQRSSDEHPLLFFGNNQTFFAFKQSSCIFASHLTKKEIHSWKCQIWKFSVISHEDHRPNVVAWKVKGTVIVNGIVLSLALAPRPQDGHTHVEARSSPSSSSHRRHHPHNSNFQKVPVIDIFCLDLYMFICMSTNTTIIFT